MGEFLPQFLKKRADLTPDRHALYFEGSAYTFKQLYEASSDMAGKLAGAGAGRGSYAGVLLKNHSDSVFILLALQLLGATAVILNNRLTAEEIGWQLTDSNASILITEAAFTDKTRELSLDGCSMVTKEALAEQPSAAFMEEEEVSLDQVCTIMYTSGTTGHPKGVLQTYGNHWWSASGSAFNLGVREDDCWLCAVPLFHISGYSILMRSLIYGIPVVLHGSFSEEQTITDIREKKVTIMSVVSTMLSRLAAAIGENGLPSHFRCMLLGGGPASRDLLEKCTAKGLPVFQSYGMTETSSQIVTLAPEYSFSKLGSAGKPLFPSQLRIMEGDREADKGQAGEIAVKGPNVTPGYLNREAETAKAMRDGWFYTGDIGMLDEEGFLYVLDRRSDLIISGGENIYPAEIEGVLTSHPAIADAGVIGQKDSKWGEVPAAFIQIIGGAKLSSEEIEEFCLGKLAKYKVPKTCYFVEEIPRNASRKILRRELRAMLGKGGEGL
ncbi:o-succinylbenzoate--CoA ligase [Bacillus infantis]|uniref:o-succinylbenzoate--CoA ligase n=1 Tax=Bacillus infantis TaxID=324767 RepID=UPI001CD24D3D|nr:o-succinylbenzoate--CoA ligase [Bacillus infantis]MCA1038692.1 o-succinylbenzoate--CoA ligase [Bacillus infantis]